jgi:CheY-like chemotaxis protein
MPAGASMRVLVVEDYQGAAQVLVGLLTHWGYEVSPAENLQGGLSKLEGEPIDIILCDIPLPDRTGYALLSEARRPGKKVLAIALSGYGYPSDVQIAELIGFDHHLSKPCHCHLLRSLLREKSA